MKLFYIAFYLSNLCKDTACEICQALHWALGTKTCVKSEVHDGRGASTDEKYDHTCGRVEWKQLIWLGEVGQALEKGRSGERPSPLRDLSDMVASRTAAGFIW